MKSIPVKLRNIKASTRALVDDEDYDELMRYKWRLDKHGYATRNENITKYKISKSLCHLMHRDIMKMNDGKNIDHINGNPLDNRKENLRFCTTQQNSWNRGKQKNNTTGFKGVRKAHNGKFQAQLGCINRTLHLGTFLTAEEASIAYIEKAKEIYGKFFRA